MTTLILVAAIAVVYGAALAMIVNALRDTYRRPAPVAIDTATTPLALPAGADPDQILALYTIVDTPDGPRVRWRA